MKAIPEEIRNQIRPGLTVVWWGRRSSFEIVEEVSEAIFHNFWIWGACILAYQMFEFDTMFQALGFLIPALLFSGKAINEVAYWLNEIYVVATDEINSGGRVYKFYGWLNKAHIDEAITSNSPTKIAERPFWFRVWRYFTGQGMERVKLHSQNHTFLEGRKMPYAFARAIDQVGGYKSSQLEAMPPDLQAGSLIQQLVFAGLIGKEFARAAATETIRRHVYGGE
jgi:hypothetical protein